MPKNGRWISSDGSTARNLPRPHGHEPKKKMGDIAALIVGANKLGL